MDNYSIETNNTFLQMIRIYERQSIAGPSLH